MGSFTWDSLEVPSISATRVLAGPMPGLQFENGWILVRGQERV
jgi:hypothetical protein